MNPFIRLLEQQPLIFVHMISAIGALALGAVVLSRRKGTASHRAIGWTWVLLMGTATATSAFILDQTSMPNIAGFTPIHLFTAFVGVALPRAVIAARRGNTGAHRKTMHGIYLGGCIVAGLFTLLPGRFLGHLLWQTLPGLLA